jgi:hypothetical protein
MKSIALSPAIVLTCSSFPLSLYHYIEHASTLTNVTLREKELFNNTERGGFAHSSYPHIMTQVSRNAKKFHETGLHILQFITLLRRICLA